MVSEGCCLINISEIIVTAYYRHKKLGNFITESKLSGLKFSPSKVLLDFNRSFIGFNSKISRAN